MYSSIVILLLLISGYQVLCQCPGIILGPNTRTQCNPVTRHICVGLNSFQFCGEVGLGNTTTLTPMGEVIPCGRLGQEMCYDGASSLDKICGPCLPSDSCSTFGMGSYAIDGRCRDFYQCINLGNNFSFTILLSCSDGYVFSLIQRTCVKGGFDVCLRETVPCETTSPSPTSPTSASSPTSPTSASSPTSPTSASSPTSPTSASSPTSPTIASSPTSPTSASSPTSPTSASSPTSPTIASSPTSPTIASSPTSPTSASSPTSPTSASSPTSPTSASSPTSPTSATSPTSPTTRVCVDGHKIADPNSCVMYSVCATGRYLQRKCPFGRYYDEVTTLCGSPLTTNCGSRPTPPPSI